MKFLLNLFRKKRLPRKVEVIELHDWLEDASEDMLATVHKNIEKKFDEYESSVLVLRSALESYGELDPDDLSSRDYHMFTGNRKAFVSRISQFLEAVGRPEEGLEAAKLFVEHFMIQSQELETRLQKYQLALLDVLEEETQEVMKSLKSVEDKMISIRELISGDDVSRATELFHRIHSLNELVIRLRSLDQRNSEILSEMELSEKKKEKIENKMKKMRESSGFSEYSSLQNKKDKYSAHAGSFEKDLLNKLSSLAPYIQKWMSKKKDMDLFKSYLDNVSDAVMGDKSNQIISLISEFAKAAEKNKANIPKTRKKKVLSTTASIDEGYLLKVKEAIEKKSEKMRNLNSKIEKSVVMMDYKEYEYQLDHIADKLDKLRNELEDIDLEKTNLGIERTRKSLEKDIEEYVKKEVEIMI